MTSRFSFHPLPLIMRRFGIYLLRIVVVVLAIAVLIALVTLQFVDPTPALKQPRYKTMQHRLADYLPFPAYGSDSIWKSGYARLSIIPEFPVSTAGYGSRRGKISTGILDSLYVNVIVLDNEEESVALVSLDMLIVPPDLVDLLETKLAGTSFTMNQVYLGATHTHNGLGNWSEGAPQLLYGEYSQEVITFLADRIVMAIQQASAHLIRSQLFYGTSYEGRLVKNRIDKVEGRLDSTIRVLEIQREDDKQLMLVSYTAHPTCLRENDLRLSRDYPGKLTDSLEAKGVDFAMFYAGAVGSHGCRVPERGEPCLEYMAGQLADKILHLEPRLLTSTSLGLSRIKLDLGPPQLRVSDEVCLRPWVFRRLIGESPLTLTSLQIGDLVMLGTPCDFSGELTQPLDSAARLQELSVMVTSFNGGYAGYITRDDFYHRDHYETRLMNWYGPGNGAYFQDLMLGMIQKHSR